MTVLVWHSWALDVAVFHWRDWLWAWASVLESCGGPDARAPYLVEAPWLGSPAGEDAFIRGEPLTGGEILFRESVQHSQLLFLLPSLWEEESGVSLPRHY